MSGSASTNSGANLASKLISSLPRNESINALLRGLGFVLLACLLTFNHSAERIKPAAVDPVKLESLKATMQRWVDEKTLPNCAVLVLQYGDRVFQHEVGTLDVSSGSVVQPDSLYRIYSMTKPVTSIAALMLIDQGLLSLDEPVDTILPEFSSLQVLSDAGLEPAQPMTLRHLLTHSAGLSYGYYGNTEVDRMYRKAGLIDDWDYLVPTTHDLVVELGKIPLLFQPGSRFHYGFSSDVLGEVVSRVSEKPLDEYFEETLWRPLGVKDAYFDVPEGVLHRFGTNHHPYQNEAFPIQDSPWEDPEFRDVSFLSGGGGLVMTIADYGKFANFLLTGADRNGNSLISKELHEELFKNQLDPGGFQFGLGLALRQHPHPLDKSQTVTAHYWGGAAGTSFFVDRERHLAVVFFTQLIGGSGEPAANLIDHVYRSM